MPVSAERRAALRGFFEECRDCRRMRGTGHKELCRVGRFFQALQQVAS